MMCRNLFVALLLVGSGAMKFATKLEAQITGKDVSNAALEQFERFDNASIRWEMKRSPGKFQGAHLKYSLLVYKQIMSDHRKSLSDEQANTLRELIKAYELFFENRQKKHLKIDSQLVRSAGYVQVQCSPVFSTDSAEDESNKYEFPEKLATTDYLKTGWKGGLIYSVFDPPKCLIFSELEYRPLSYEIHTDQGTTVRTIFYRWKAPLHLPDIDAKACEIPSAFDMAVVTDTRPGSFMKFLKVGKWEFSELADGNIALTRSTSIDQHEIYTDVLTDDDVAWVTETVDVITASPNAGMLPVRLERYRRDVVDGKFHSVRPDDEVLGIFKGLHLDPEVTFAKGYSPSLIATFEWDQSPNGEFYYLKNNVEHLFMTVPRGLSDLTEFPGKPRLTEDLSAGPTFAVMDVDAGTEFVCGLHETTTLKTTRVVVYDKPLEAGEFKFECPEGVEERNNADAQDVIQEGSREQSSLPWTRVFVGLVIVGLAISLGSSLYRRMQKR